jgi:tetratricopeptide (TPR) repeat protein
MSTRMYGLMVQLVSSVKDEKQRAKCAEAVRQNFRAISLISSGEYEAAIRTNEEALDLIHDVPEAAVLTALCQATSGMALFQLGRHDDSQEFSLAAVPVLLSSPQFANEAATCLNVVGGSLLCQGKSQESIKAFEGAINIWSRLPGSETKISDCRDNLTLARKRKASQSSAISPKPEKPRWKFW